jgi:uncharacterized membrane protein
MNHIVFLVMSLVFFILLFLLPGFLLYKGNPSEPNNIFGFRTKLSTKSKEAWYYANNLAGKLIIIYGFIYLFINILIFIIMRIISFSDDLTVYMIYLQLGLFIAFYLLMFLIVQNKLKKYFDINGKRKL